MTTTELSRVAVEVVVGVTWVFERVASMCGCECGCCDGRVL